MKKTQAYLQTNPKFRHTVVGYIVRNGEILLGIRKRVSHGLGELLIAGIGGGVEGGETEEEALDREFREEIKVSVTSCRLIGHATYMSPHKPKWNQKTSIYIVEGWEGEPQETEDIQPMWVKQDQLPQDRMWPDNLITIPKVLAEESFEAKFLYKEDGMIEEYRLNER